MIRAKIGYVIYLKTSIALESAIVAGVKAAVEKT